MLKKDGKWVIGGEKRQEKETCLDRLYLLFLSHTYNLKHYSTLKCFEVFVQAGVARGSRQTW